MTVNVLIAAHFQEQWLERLQRLSPDLHITLHPVDNDQPLPASAWQDVEVAYTFSQYLPLPEQAPHLRWVQLYSAGADQVLHHPLFQTSVLFTTTSGIHAVPIGEYVLTVMLAWFHRLPLLLKWQQQSRWVHDERSDEFKPEELRDKIIGIVGYGSIGREVARLAQAFGMRVLAMQRGSDHRDTGFILPGVGDPDGSIPERYYTFEQLHTMLHESDVVMIGVPLTEQTYHLFNEAAFQAMKPTSFLVNIARGDVCDEEALIHALAEKQIAGAALDVVHTEPLPADSPLWKLPNVIITPHISGLSPRYDERAAMVFEENLRRYLQGQPLFNLVEKARGY